MFVAPIAVSLLSKESVIKLVRIGGGWADTNDAFALCIVTVAGLTTGEGLSTLEHAGIGGGCPRAARMPNTAIPSAAINQANLIMQLAQ